MPFADRREAGRKLAEKVREIAQENAVVVGLPRGGVPVAYEVAQALGLPLDITCPHKIGAPGNPEYAIGAVTERGEGIFGEERAPRDYLEREVAHRTEQAKERLRLYRGDQPPLELKGRQVILIDDGLATGFTMKAAIASVRTAGPSEIVVAVPVAPPDTVEEIGQLADRVVCLEMPPNFQAVGQFYREFGQTSDEEVIALLQNS